MEVPRGPIQDHIRTLRKALDQSQQALAVSLGLSLRAVSNYERGKMPEARVLVALAKHADNYGRLDLGIPFLQFAAQVIDACEVTI